MLKLYKDDTELNLEVFKFPGGEVHFKLDMEELLQGPLLSEWKIVTDLHDSDELMLLLLLADHLGGVPKELQLLYTPYARQDRETSICEPFSLRTCAKLINQCNFNKVTLYDPHSDVTPALINRCEVGNMDKPFWIIKKNDIIVSPDAGAMKKNEKLCVQYKKPHVLATKNRDLLTGEITQTKVHTDIDLKGKRLLIIDDICDGGRTFIELAKVLKKYEPKEINLYVTVGIFSKGFDVVKEHFDNIHYFHRKELQNDN